MRLLMPGAIGSLGVAALLLAACGGGASTAPAATTAPKTETKAAATSAPAAAPTTAPASATKTESKTAGSSPQAASGVAQKATGDPITIGHMCDRSGATANVGTKLCDGFMVMLDTVNNQLGGAKGRPIRTIEVDHKYEVPLAVDAYKKLTTRDNVPQILSYGTPITDALAPSANQDKVVLWTPGYGLSESADGKKFPYVFVGVATYYSQGAAAMQYVADDWKAKGGQGMPKVIYSYYDNPAGRDPLELIQKESKGIGLDLIDSVAVPATTVDMTTVMTQMKDKNPDYIITHYFGRMPALSLQAAEKVGYPRNQMVSFVWGNSHDEIEVAKQAAEGLRGLHFSALPSDNPQAYQMMRQNAQNGGMAMDDAKANSVWYARGALTGAVMAEAMRLADDPTKGESVKAGAESLKDFTAYGMSKGTTLTPEDHGGSRALRMYEIKNGDLVQVRDWFEGPLTETEKKALQGDH